MSFSTRKMTGTAEATGPQIHIDSPYAMVQKTATPQLPPMLRLKTATPAQQHLMTPAQVQITVCPSTQNPTASLAGNGSLFPSSILNQTTSRVSSEPEADWGKHDLLSAVPNLKASLCNLDKEVRVVGADADTTKSVLQMHNSILQSHDGVLEKQTARTRETRKMCLELEKQHASHKQNTKEYLVMTQGMLESHDAAIKEHDQILQELATSTPAEHSEKIRALSDSNENTRQYLELNQGMMESYHRSIQDLTEMHNKHAKLLDDMYTKQDAKSQLTLSESMLRETKFLTQQVEDHKLQLAALQKSNNDLRDRVRLQQDELDALHDKY